MLIKTAEFERSSPKHTDCPPGNRPEFAFIGRSNVGKSSLINMLTGNNKLAKTSQTPGKTQLINHFIINSQWYIVDLPGYGYARVSKSNRSGFEKMIKDYVTLRDNLCCLFVLIDSRIEPQALDLAFIRFLGENGVPFALIATKTDKVSPDKVDSNLAQLKRELRKEWDELPPIIITSSVTRNGRDELLKFIDSATSEWIEKKL